MKSILIIILLLVIQVNFITASDIKTEFKSKQEHIKYLLSLLDDEYAYKRNWAVHNLSLIGDKVVEYIINKFKTRNYRVRREMVTILGNIGTVKANEFLLNTIMDSDYGVRNRASFELLKICDINKKFIHKIKNLKPENKKVSASISNLISIINYNAVEKELAKLVSPQGGYGFYEGQFKDMLYLKNRALKPLVKIFTDKKYFFVNKKIDENEILKYKLRYLSGQAIPAFAPYIKDKKAILNELKKMLFLSNDKELKEIAMTSLYFLGETEHLNRKIADVKNLIKVCKRSRYLSRKLGTLYSELGMLYLRILKEKQGIQMLQKAVKISPHDSLLYYNLACAYACLNKIDKALEVLETSISKGYEDLNWILKDGDLRNIHHTKRFKKIIQKLRQKLKK